MDGHAHIHPWMDRDRALDFAFANFLQCCRTAGLDPASPKVLALADPVDGKGLEVSEAGAANSSSARSGWTLQGCEDGTGVRARRRGDGATLFLVRGRQVRATGGLEVLALATREEFRTGGPLAETVAEIQQVVGFAVIPWGFGKWLGRRGRLVREILGVRAGEGVLVGDNAGRLARTPSPGIFRLARKLGIPILPGSDPLPLPGQERKLGSYGFTLSGGFDPLAPGTSLREALTHLGRQPGTVGERDGLVPFLLSQGRMQGRKLTRRLGGSP